ncbi:hypothetical protein [Kitasatospora cineracea]|uniref:GLTT repeat-containing protein n=1 Tax=Kitasatospora cineracea TaxID=88074 RepID=A0A3N4SCF9_9ACTN|nr:hypothetical protein [Kitasatospora cineracea]ROR43781.1 hypothetical protein EDD39_1950 [Kitasatospora cineracea]RPE34124.1 hypothetical protein EDD38_2434 [Kitasatospora cineracea]
MKLSKRATGALLLAVGAGVVAAQGAAQAAPKTPAEVAAIENGLATQEVPFSIPLSAATAPLPLLPDGGEVHGGIPTSPLMPPTGTDQSPTRPIPDHVLPALNGGKAGPSLGAVLPLPEVDRGAELGTLGLDAPAAPLNLGGPAVGLGQPVSFVEGRGGRLTDAALTLDKVDPHLVTAPVQAVPGASASLGGEQDQISVTDSVRNLAATTTATTGEMMNQADPVGILASGLDRTQF